MASKQNPAHILLEKHLAELGLIFVPEVRFHPVRRWRFDYVVNQSLAIEIDGGLWVTGQRSHAGGTGKQADMNKRNTATMMGFRVLVFSTEDVLRGRARAFLKEHLKP